MGIELRWYRVAVIVVVVLSLGERAHAAMSDDDLHRYGFDDTMVHTVNDTRYHDVPTQAGSTNSIPAPAVPGVSPTDQEIPEPTTGPSRLIQQGGPGTAAPYEGPTRIYRGSDGKELEGTFREVENFFYRPDQHYDHFLMMNEHQLTGLFEMYTGEIDRKGTSYLSVGLQYVSFTRSYGQTLANGRYIDKFSLPVGFMTVPSKDVEVSGSILVFSENAQHFPFVGTYDQGGVQDINLETKYRFLDNPEERLSAAFLFGIDVGTLATITKLGSNGVDFMMGLAGTKRNHNYGFHLDGGWIFCNGSDQSNNHVPDIGFADVGMDFQTGESLDFTLELNYTDFLNIGTRVDVTPGVKWKISEKWRFELGVPLSVTNSMPAGDTARLVTQFQFKF